MNVEGGGGCAAVGEAFVEVGDDREQQAEVLRVAQDREQQLQRQVQQLQPDSAAEAM